MNLVKESFYGPTPEQGAIESIFKSLVGFNSSLSGLCSVVKTLTEINGIQEERIAKLEKEVAELREKVCI